MSELERRFREIAREEATKVVRAHRVDHESERLLTIVEAADVANVSASTIRRWLKAGRIARYGIGRAARVNRAELLDAMRRPTRQENGHLSPEERARRDFS